VRPSIIPNDFDAALTRREKACAAGAIASSSLRVFAPSRDTIQRAAA
jgi:hypothetical protein